VTLDAQVPKVEEPAMTQQVPQQVQPDEAPLTVSTSRPVASGRRPGLVTFAAVMMGVLSTFAVIAAITEWSNSVWLYQRNFSVAGSHLVFWGFVDFGLALLLAYGAYLLAIGHRSGQVLGFLFAGISLVRWMFYIPADPWLAITVLTIDALIIYGLAVNDDWFARSV
jgi:hypothetical protein